MSGPTAGWIEELTRTISSRLVVTEDDARRRDHRAKTSRRTARVRAVAAAGVSLGPPRPSGFSFPRLATIPTRPPSAKRVVFLGHAGTGKTTLAVALLRVLLDRKIASHPFASDGDVAAVARHCRFAAAHRLGVAALVPGDPLEIRRAMRAPILLIDDLGKDADINSNPVPSIIAERHAEERVTWVTTELSPDAIANRYGGGVARRIFESAELIRFH